MDLGRSFLCVEQQKSEADHSHLSNVGVNNGGLKPHFTLRITGFLGSVHRLEF
jgi:hypothetical protein